MKFVTYLSNGAGRLGLLVGNDILDLERASAETAYPLPNDIIPFLHLGESAMKAARKIDEIAKDANAFRSARIAADSVKLLAPVPRPTSMRDGYAFRQHVEAARRNRGVEMIAEFDLFPVFYFTNHQAVIGPRADGSDAGTFEQTRLRTRSCDRHW